MTGDDRTDYLAAVTDADVGPATGGEDGWQFIVDEATGVVYTANLFVGQDIPRLEIAALIDAGELPL